MAKNAGKTLAVICAATALSLGIAQLGVSNESVIMVFLLGVLMTAVWTSSRPWAIGAAAVSLLLFNYLFTEPRFTFLIYSTGDLVMLAFFLITAVISGTVTSRLQRERAEAGRNEQTADTLYRIASGFLPVTGQEAVVKKGEELMREYAGLECRVVLDARRSDGFPIETSSGALGVLQVSGGEPGKRQQLIARAVCSQLGIALEREALVDEREKIRMEMERERQRTMLLRSVAHDLRSPLTALSGAGNLLADHYGELTDAERRKLASDVSEETVWLTDLVENTLNMTRISDQQLVLHKQDEVVDDIVAEAVRHTERLLRGRKLTVKLPDEVITVPMDGRLVVQVIINLLENAARHTPAGCDIALTVRQEGEFLRVSVADSGEGVPPSIRDRLFERFVTQESGVVDGRRGLGLGLAICKTIVEAHGGRIGYEDNQPKGAVFSFTLPMEASDER